MKKTPREKFRTLARACVRDAMKKARRGHEERVLAARAIEMEWGKK